MSTYELRSILHITQIRVVFSYQLDIVERFCHLWDVNGVQNEQSELTLSHR